MIIKSGTIIDPEKEDVYEADIYIKDGIIKKIGINLEVDDCETIDAKGLCVAPGFVDVHSHFRDPGFEYKEDIITGAEAAAAGGYTSVVLMANTRPSVDNADTVKYVLDKGELTDIHVYTCATVTMGMEGKTITDMDSLMESGAVGFTDDGKPIMDEELVRKAMKKVCSLNVPISFHEEDPSFIKSNGVNSTSPREAEISLIKRDLEIALETGAHINIQHISSREGVELVRNAAARSTKGNIHAEATPHHFSLTEEAVEKYGTLAKMNPPLRTEDDRMAIIQGLKDGTIDLIATDHAPHSKEEKSAPLEKAPSGIIGLETALSLGITNLVEPGYLTLNDFMKKMALNPAVLYGLNAGTIKENAPADICIFDKNQEVTYTSYKSKSENSPFTGMPLKGRVIYTICKGKTVYNGYDA